MSASTTERRLARFTFALALLFTGAGGCADDAEAGADTRGDAFPEDRPDVGPPGDMGACTLTFEGTCLDDRETRCALFAEVFAAEVCFDVDGDCFPGDCDDTRYDAVADCDDTRPEVNPLGEQRCDGVDGDCDGRIDEGFESVGQACDACGVSGKYECAVDDPSAVACSTAAGQSQGPDPVPEELCNGADDDCDGVVDESCRLPPRGGTATMPALCPDGRLAFVEDGALVVGTPSVDGGFSFATLREPPVRVAHPSCGPLGLAWLELTGECTTPPDGPERCEAELWVALADEAPRVFAPLGALGPPVVGAERIYWHTLPGPMPFILARAPGEDAARQVFDRALSDPTPPVAGQMLVREWDAGVPRMRLANLGTDGRPGTGNIGLDEPPPALGRPGAATRSSEWMAWALEGERTTVWVVPQGDTRGGFFPFTREGDQRAPRLAGDRLVWLDEGTAPPTLRAFDLATGTERALATGAITPDGFAVARGAVVWIAGGGGDVFYRALSPIGE